MGSPVGTSTRPPDSSHDQAGCCEATCASWSVQGTPPPVWDKFWLSAVCACACVCVWRGGGGFQGRPGLGLDSSPISPAPGLCRGFPPVPLFTCWWWGWACAGGGSEVWWPRGGVPGAPENSRATEVHPHQAPTAAAHTGLRAQRGEQRQSQNMTPETDPPPPPPSCRRRGERPPDAPVRMATLSKQPSSLLSRMERKLSAASTLASLVLWS